MKKKILHPVTEEALNAAEFLDLDERQLKNIKKTEFVLPEFGKGGFGEFRVKYSTPVLKEA